MTDQGKIFVTFIEAQLAAEYERRTAYDARGQALITTSGALFTLLAVITAVTRTPAVPQLPSAVLIAVGVTLSLFVAATVCGVVAGWNKPHEVATPETLTHMLATHWTDTEVSARHSVATLSISTLVSLRRSNAFKALCVAIGLAIQVAALFALGVTAFMTIAAL
ncbi:hypothetical protein ACIP5Y_33665 [Nocardia sp. NPDC088792]|uniref:hypothetical protein n=1 Tax=Nocardia sp. NPDC088792 TaxID=3364332 RepID=UPI003822A8CF